MANGEGGAKPPIASMQLSVQIATTTWYHVMFDTEFSLVPGATYTIGLIWQGGFPFYWITSSPIDSYLGGTAGFFKFEATSDVVTDYDMVFGLYASPPPPCRPKLGPRGVCKPELMVSRPRGGFLRKSEGKIYWQSFTATTNWTIEGVFMNIGATPMSEQSCLVSIYAGQEIINGSGHVKSAMASKQFWIRSAQEIIRTDWKHVKFDTKFSLIPAEIYTLALLWLGNMSGYWASSNPVDIYGGGSAGYYLPGQAYDIILDEDMAFGVLAYPPPPCRCEIVSDCPLPENHNYNTTCNLDGYCVNTAPSVQGITIVAATVSACWASFAIIVVIIYMRRWRRKEHRHFAVQ